MEIRILFRVVIQAWISSRQNAMEMQWGGMKPYWLTVFLGGLAVVFAVLLVTDRRQPVGAIGAIL